ncbi:MAG: DUF1800 family protein [Acidobacteriota bacterium]
MNASRSTGRMPRALRSVVLSLILLTGVSAAAHALTVTSLTPSPTLPKPYGTTITWTANVTGATGTVEYQFWRFSAQTGTWSVVQVWGTNRTFAWTPSSTEMGTYSMQVWARNQGSAAAYDGWIGTPSFVITNRLPSVVTFTPNVTFPKQYNSSIRWTVTTTGGVGPLFYRFWRYSYATATWVIVQDYGTSNTYTWTPTAGDIGKYALQVWLRNNGSSTTYDGAGNSGTFDIIGPPPRIVSLSSTKTFPTPAGAPITFSTVATGGVQPLQYQYWLYHVSTGAWVVERPYSSSSTWTWTPQAADAGNYYLQVWVRNAGETVAYDVYYASGSFQITGPAPLAVSAIIASPGVPRPVTSVVQWTATATGGVQPLQYKFWRYKASTGIWSVVQDWSGSSTWSWTTAPADAGNYSVQVWARNAGSSANYDAWKGTSAFTITQPTSDIVRFLEQASFGPSDALIEHVRQIGMSAWIDEQFIESLSGYPPLPSVPDDVPVTCDSNCQRDNYTMYPLQNQFFRNALYGDDQLRQRVAWTLHQLFVVSGNDVTIPGWYIPYLNAVYQGAFGNYRDLLYNITLNPGMGSFLNMDTNTRQNPNENYGREILQLFSVGTDLLYPDGTPQLNLAGTPIAVYDQTLVTEFARVFTGWRRANDLAPGFSNYFSSMQVVTGNHDTGQKVLLGGQTLPAGQTPAKDLQDALDNIFNHPNVGPFIAKHFIRQMVTSNPSPAFVGRVAAAFNNNGSGVRGDLRAMVKVMLLDPEARTPTATPAYGHLKEPALFVTNILRAFNAVSANGQAQSDGYLNPQTASVNQDVFKPPTVFNYYPADYIAPNTTILGPEFGTVSTVSALRRANIVNTLVFSKVAVSGNAPQGTSIDFAVLLSIAGNPPALVKELDRLMMHDTMSAQMKTSILGAVNAVPLTNPLLRVQTALYLVATSSQYQVEQ